MALHFLGIVLVAVLPPVGLVVWCCMKPAVAPVLARIFSVVALGVGVGALTWGICAAVLGDAIRTPFGSFITAPSEAIGCGAGFFAAGVAALVLSFTGGNSSRGQADSSQ